MLSIVPKYETVTIESYAHYVLDDPQVKALIATFKNFQRVADKLINSFEDLVDQGVLKFEPEDLKIAREFNQMTEKTKNEKLQSIIDTFNGSNDWRYPLQLHSIILRDESLLHPNRSDIPLIMFRDFANNRYFKDYLYKGSVDIINPLYFSKDMDPDRQKYLVFAVFLWSHMDPKRGTNDVYYDYAPYDERNDRQISTIRNRIRFLELFKKYIHFELWHEADYARRNLNGTILRLDLERRNTGGIVTQDCGEKSNKCNTPHLITDDLLADLIREYLGPNTILRKLESSLKCEYCGKRAYLLDKMKRFYCTQQCYHKMVQ